MVEIQTGKRTVRSQLAAAGDSHHSQFVVVHLEILLGPLVTDAHSQCVSSVVGGFLACGTCQMKCQNTMSGLAYQKGPFSVTLSTKVRAVF